MVDLRMTSLVACSMSAPDCKQTQIDSQTTPRREHMQSQGNVKTPSNPAYKTLSCSVLPQSELQQGSYLRLEAHVNHAVGFIQHHIVALVEHRVGLLQTVQ